MFHRFFRGSRRSFPVHRETAIHLDDKEFTDNLDENLKNLKEALGDPADLIWRRLESGKKTVAVLLHFETLVDRDLLGRQVIEPLNRWLQERKGPFDDEEFREALTIPKVLAITHLHQAVERLLAGDALLLAAGAKTVLALPLLGVPRRQVEELAESEDLNDVLDFIGRMPLTPTDVHVLVAKSDPEKLLAMANKDNYVPGNYIHFYFRSPAIRSLAISMQLWRVHSLLDRKTGDPFLPMIEEYQQMYRIAGTALFSRNRMVGELTKEETEVLALLRGTDVGYLHFGDVQQETFGFSQIRSKTKIRPHFSPDDRSLAFDLDVEVIGVLVESLPHKEIRWEEKQEIERKAEELIKEKSEKLIAKLQGLLTDPIGFGRKFRIAYPREWKTLDWEEVYPAAKITVNPSFTITQTGLFK